MKKAQIDLAWEKCREIQANSLAVCSINVQLNSKELDFNIKSRVTGIVGANGVGKSTFLDALESLFRKTPRLLHRTDLKVCKVKGIFRGKSFELPTEQTSQVVEKVDVSLEVHRFQNFVYGVQNFDELLPQVGCKNLIDSERAEYCYANSKNYTSIKIFELELPGETESDFPFFELTLDGITYDNRSMGFGELCSCFVIWKIRRQEKGSVLLFDEPDAHISPNCRIKLINIFAFIAHERKLQIFFTSHAIETIKALVLDEIILVDPAFDQVNSAASKKYLISRKLGMVTAPKFLLCTEDVDGCELLMKIWTRFGGSMSNLVEVNKMLGGATELIRLQRLFPDNSQVCKLRIVLDGDKKTEFGTNKKILFLPGNLDPVQASREYVIGNPNFFAATIGVDVEILSDCLFQISHVDHHDFCAELSRELNIQGVTVERIRSSLFLAWLEDPSIADEVSFLINSIKEFIEEQKVDLFG
jgi:predicted ATPase